jgi:hypothetical protein
MVPIPVLFVYNYFSQKILLDRSIMDSKFERKHGHIYEIYSLDIMFNTGKGEWRKLHNEELNDLCFSPNIVRVIISRKMRWAVHVARMEESRIQSFVGKPEGKKKTWETQA